MTVRSILLIVVTKTTKAQLGYQNEQKVVEIIAKDQPQNVFLWGSSGTGKTIMLAEAMKMKISHYMKQGKKLNIFVTSYMATPESQLLKLLKDKYLSHIPSGNHVKFMPFHLLCKGYVN